MNVAESHAALGVTPVLAPIHALTRRSRGTTAEIAELFRIARSTAYHGVLFQDASAWYEQRVTSNLEDPAPAFLGELGAAALVLPGATRAMELDALFRADRALRAVVIETAGVYSLLTRAQLEFHLTGRLGYGRELSARAVAIDLLPDSASIMSALLGLPEAARAILERPEEYRYQDLLVLGSGGPRIVPVSEVFESLSAVFRHASLHDSLTGLPNRRMLEEQLPALAGDTQTSRVGILYIDLDDFKTINDTFGHRAGDAVLAGFAQRLKRSVRPGDTVARLGGDEFAVLLADADEDTVRGVAHRVLECLDQPFAHDGNQLRISATLGLAMASDISVDQELSGIEVLLRHADGAMLQAKQDGKRRVGRIRSGPLPAPFARHAHIRRRLPAALNEGAFMIHYQPLLDIVTGTETAVEALLRWSDSELGSLTPDEFIPIAEGTGDIHPISRWVIDRTCAQARSWADAGKPRKISVNISPLQFATGTLVDEVTAALDRHGVQPHLLEIEITEGAAAADIPGTAAQLRELMNAGVGVALDDYGTGHSSLAMLRDLPLTTLKIDKSFIERIDTDPVSAKIVAGVINTAKALGLRTTAEGVERETQLAVLRDLACDTAQGYLISHPVPAEQIS